MTLEGTEKILKITGAGAERVAELLYKLLRELAKESEKTKGQMRLANMIKSGKRLEIFEIPDGSLKQFCELAKKYGVVYTVLKDKNKLDGKCEIMVKEDDSQKINHILRRMEIVVKNTGAVETDADRVKEAYEKAKGKTPGEGQPAPERTGQEKSREDQFLDELMRKPNPTKEASEIQNPGEARTPRSRQSVPGSESREDTAAGGSSERGGGEARPSVRAELKKYREEIETAEEKAKIPEKSKASVKGGKSIEHKAVKKKTGKERG